MDINGLAVSHGLVVGPDLISAMLTEQSEVADAIHGGRVDEAERLATTHSDHATDVLLAIFPGEGA
jgi:hypothetical protein